MTHQAPYACRACRRLKRKCSRDIPCCALCTRLNKSCEYSGLPSPPSNNVSTAQTSFCNASQLFNLHTIPPSSNSTPDLHDWTSGQVGPSQRFPQSFFIDGHLFTPINARDLSQGSAPWTLDSLQDYIGSDPLTVCDQYFNGTHQWLPMVSKKRCLNEIQQPNADTCHPLLLLCMKLCTCRLESSSSMNNPLYTLAKRLCAAAEMGGFISIRLVQSFVLIAVHELSHGLHSAAYLTIGHAARLGVLALGLPTYSQGQKLFKPPETWTLWEERRRTWWAIFILDRFINVDNLGLQFATAEPSTDDLLPVNDDDWEQGNVVPNEPVFTESFSTATTLGHFAQSCQAAHILSRVIRHIKTKRSSGTTEDLLIEARHIHNALSALQLSLEGSGTREKTGSGAFALAICCSARFKLSREYACNESPGGSKPHGHYALAAELQGICLEAVKSMTLSTVPKMLSTNVLCPLTAHAMYCAAEVAAWFAREDHEPEVFEALKNSVERLRHISETWAVGSVYLDLLAQYDNIELLDAYMEGLIHVT